MSIDNFDLKCSWVLWFHKVNDNNWSDESYIKISDIRKYHDILFIIKRISNITSGMFFLMKDGIKPVFEDINNINGGYWSIRISKKDSLEFWTKIVYYICIDSITIKNEYENNINGISISPKINNCIFKIWNNNFKDMKTEYLKKNLDFINWSDSFYLQHNDTSSDKK